MAGFATRLPAGNAVRFFSPDPELLRRARRDRLFPGRWCALGTWSANERALRDQPGAAAADARDGWSLAGGVGAAGEQDREQARISSRQRRRLRGASLIRAAPSKEVLAWSVSARERARESRWRAGPARKSGAAGRENFEGGFGTRNGARPNLSHGGSSP